MPKNNSVPIIVAFSLAAAATVALCVAIAMNGGINFRNHVTSVEEPVSDDNDCGEECPICYEKSDEEIAKLECGHKFHKACLKCWVETQIYQHQDPTCPICRRNISKNDLKKIRK